MGCKVCGEFHNEWLKVKFVIVGELNPYGTDPKTALYHLPRGASGDRLRVHLGLRDSTYAALPKVNLCTGVWNDVEARTTARGLLFLYNVLITLGTKVARAVRDGAETPLLSVSSVHSTRGFAKVLALPHPSGRCRVWNDLVKHSAAVRMLREHLPMVPWGEVKGRS